jgi:hypothetical protein
LIYRKTCSGTSLWLGPGRDDVGVPGNNVTGVTSRCEWLLFAARGHYRPDFRRRSLMRPRVVTQM